MYPRSFEPHLYPYRLCESQRDFELIHRYADKRDRYFHPIDKMNRVAGRLVLWTGDYTKHKSQEASEHNKNETHPQLHFDSSPEPKDVYFVQDPRVDRPLIVFLDPPLQQLLFWR